VNPESSSANRTTHILTATQGRLDFAMAIRALGNLYFVSVVELEYIIFQRGVTLAASCINAHSAFFTFIGCHHFSPVYD